MTSLVSEQGRQCMACSIICSMTLQTQILQQELQILSYKIIFHKSFNSVLKIYSLVGNIKNDLVKYFMQHIRNGLIVDSINS